MTTRLMDEKQFAAHQAKVRAHKYGGGAGGGKTAAVERSMAEFTRKNPNATVARFRHGEALIEKPFGSGSIALVKPSRMNKTETEYAANLELLKRAGLIFWYAFEAVKLRLADKTQYTPDFAVLHTAHGLLDFQEVKGFWRDDARVKIKVAAEMFPFDFCAVTKIKKKDGGGWKVERF